MALVFITTERDASLEPGWMLRLCWINDGFVLHASSAAFCAVDDYRQGVLESNGSRSFGGTQGKLPLALNCSPISDLLTHLRSSLDDRSLRGSIS